MWAKTVRHRFQNCVLRIRRIFWGRNYLKVYIFLCFFRILRKDFSAELSKLCSTCPQRKFLCEFVLNFWQFAVKFGKSRERKICMLKDCFPFIIYVTVENNEPWGKIDTCSSRLTIPVESSMVNRYLMACHREESSKEPSMIFDESWIMVIFCESLLEIYQIRGLLDFFEKNRHFFVS